MAGRIDLIDQKFGRLLVKKLVGKNKWNNLVYECLCDCGKKVPVASGALRRGSTQSCGCLQKERTSEASLVHGGSKNHKASKEYEAWKKIKARCLNSKTKGYENYGGRGIKICDRWLEPNGQGFKNFLEDMGKCPGPSYSIERKDNDGDYCPENCVWATRKEQANNTRRNYYITFEGVTKTLTQWAEETGIHWSTLRRRLDGLNWSIEKALTAPTRKMRRHK